MVKRLFLFGILALYFNPASAGITVLSPGVLNKYGDTLVGDDRIMTLCIEGYVVLYINEPAARDTAMQLLDSNSNPLRCLDPDPLGILSEEEEKANIQGNTETNEEAKEVDLTTMSLEELIELRKKIAGEE